MNKTPNIESIISKAGELALHKGRNKVDLDLLFHCFLLDEGPTIALILDTVGVDREEWFNTSVELVNKKRPNQRMSAELNDKCVDFFDRCEYFADEILFDDYISAESMMLAFLSDDFIPNAILKLYPEANDSEELSQVCASSILHGRGLLTVDRGGDKSKEKKAESGSFNMFEKNKVLERFAENLNIQAVTSTNKIIDFDHKIDELATVLCRKTKPNALLVGPAGSGKTSILQGLAKKIVSGQAPQLLSNKVIFSVDLSSMVAGTQFRGQFEQRLEDFVKEVKKYDNIILFIDEIHTLVGAGGASSDSLEASNILKPSLANGSISCIGATTNREYKNTIKRDSALNRRFEYIAIREPSTFQMGEILPQIVDHYAHFHGVKYGKDFMDSVLKYCDLYAPNRNYPDKAIDVIDQCGAQAKVMFWETSPEIKEMKLKVFNEASTGNKDNIPAELFENLHDKFKDWLDGIQGERPEVTMEHLKCFFKNRKAPLFDTGNIDLMCRALSRHVVGQTKQIASFRDNITETNLGLTNHRQGTPQFRVIAGEKGSGKSSLLSGIHKELEGLGANVMHYNGSHFTGHDLFLKIYGYVDHNNSLCDAIQEHPDTVVLIDDFERVDQQMVEFMGDVLKTGEIQTRNGDTVDFSNVMFFVSSKTTASSSMGFVKDESVAKSDLPNSLASFVCQEIILEPLNEFGVRRLLCRKLKKISEKVEAQGLKIIVSPSFVKKFCADLDGNKSPAEALEDKVYSKLRPFIVSEFKKGEKSVILSENPQKYAERD
jgi:ATP-dependent Clp protease ATP-binding subunit ClpA